MLQSRSSTRFEKRADQYAIESRSLSSLLLDRPQRLVLPAESSRLFLCARCRCVVVICSSCDRGQIYCSSDCSEIRRRETIRQAARRYQRSAIGARNHARRQARYRSRQLKVTHHGSRLPGSAAKLLLTVLAAALLLASSHRKRPGEVPALPLEPTRCHFCGQSSSGFTRNSFLGSKEVPG